MGACIFKMSETNPNDQSGGGGCACSETKNRDQKGPFAVFYTGEMESTVSPHLVVCAGCAHGIVKAADGELLSSSADVLIDSTAEELPIADEDIPEL